MKNKIKLVIAGDINEFWRWCAEHKLSVKDYRYIPCNSVMCGYRDCVIYRIGSYYKRPDIGKINEYCVTHNIKNAYMKEAK